MAKNDSLTINAGHALCACGHTKGCHARGKSLCQLRGCGCDSFRFDGYVERSTAELLASAPKPIVTRNDWF